MSSAEGRQEVIKRILVGHIHRRQLEADFVFILVKPEQIVIAKRCVEDVPGRDTLWILVVVFHSQRGDADQLRGQLRGQADVARDRLRGGRLEAVAYQSRLELLIRGKAAQNDGLLIIDRR